MARVMGTVRRIMTVAVQQPKVGDPVVRVVPVLMMHFEPIIRGKVQAPPPTLPVLPLQELLLLWRKAGIGAEAQAPGGPGPIIGAALPRDCAMPGDRRGRRLRQPLGLPQHDEAVFALPLPVHPPPLPFVWMTPEGPSAALRMQPVIALGKDSLGDDVGVVAGPARNDPVSAP
jgi:hypothetical protein